MLSQVHIGTHLNKNFCELELDHYNTSNWLLVKNTSWTMNLLGYIINIDDNHCNQGKQVLFILIKHLLRIHVRTHKIHGLVGKWFSVATT